MKTIFSILLLIFPAIIFSQYKNVLIGDKYAPNEPTIMIDKKNPAYVLAAVNINQYFVSVDSGYTWQSYMQKSSYGVAGDPVLINDTSGNFYSFHLSNPMNGSWLDRIVCQTTTDYGETWNDGSFFGLAGSSDQDKQWAVFDPKSGNIYASWTKFDRYASKKETDSTYILFVKSTDTAKTWSEPVRLSEYAGDCIDSDNTVEGAVPTVGVNGEIYVSWAGSRGIVFDRSVDGGQTWLDNDIFVDSMPGGWEFSIPGIMRCNGMPVTVCDRSNSEHRGTIYINWADQRNGESDTDIWLRKSTDGGQTWSDALRVNNDTTHRQQFFTWLTIDQVTGYLYIIFYDRRNYEDNQTDVYLAVSRNGGESFENIRISETPFLPMPKHFFGDYTNISAHNGMIRPIWTRLHKNKLSVWTAIINDSIGNE